jgi:hypothetical protein
VTIQTLNVSLVTINGSRVLGHQRQIPVHVRRIDGEPKVTFVENLTAVPVAEGEARSFKVTVKDPNSAGGAVKPKLIILSANSSRTNLAPYVSVESGPDRDPSDPTLWKFVLRLETGSAEVTRWDSTGTFLLIALARFGRQSVPYPVDVRINTSVERPLTTWRESGEPVTTTAGQGLSFSFGVFDPKNEGRVTVAFKKCPQDALCSCDAPFSGPVTCQLNWDGLATALLGSQTFLVEFTAENNVNGRKQVQQYTRTVRVFPAPTPTPTPTPVATPEGTPVPNPSPTPN